MGYDIYVVDEHGAELPESRLGPIDDWNDRAAVQAVVKAQDEAGCYFRRNIFGMARLRERLVELGLAYEPAGGHVKRDEWPDPPEPYEQHFDDGEPLTPEALAYAEANLAVLKAPRDERPGIPLHKLGSNDGWWVTAAECRSTLQLWERAGSPMPEEFYDDFIPFLRKAAAHGGFRVW
jgi:hypothetical protein